MQTLYEVNFQNFKIFKEVHNFLTDNVFITFIRGFAMCPMSEICFSLKIKVLIFNVLLTSMLKLKLYQQPENFKRV